MHFTQSLHSTPGDAMQTLESLILKWSAYSDILIFFFLLFLEFSSDHQVLWLLSSHVSYYLENCRLVNYLPINANLGCLQLLPWDGPRNTGLRPARERRYRSWNGTKKQTALHLRHNKILISCQDEITQNLFLNIREGEWIKHLPVLVHLLGQLADLAMHLPCF